MGALFRQPFTEKLSFIYIPALIALGAAVSNRVIASRWNGREYPAAIAFLTGALVGHLALVGARTSRVYAMDVDGSYDAGADSVLFRSASWPDILFVTSPQAKAEAFGKFAGKQVPVSVSVVSDYGCTRSAVLSAVAGVDVRQDQKAVWTWQIDRESPSFAKSGSDVDDPMGEDHALASRPGYEDRRFFWCRREKPPMMENHSGLRPWEYHPVKPLAAPGAPAVR